MFNNIKTKEKKSATYECLLKKSQPTISNIRFLN